MPTLPELPALTDEQYGYLVSVFTDQAAARGLPGPVEAYVRWSLDNLIELVRAHAAAQLQAELDQQHSVRQVQMEQMLSDLIGGPTPAPTTPLVNTQQMPRG